MFTKRITFCGYELVNVTKSVPNVPENMKIMAIMVSLTTNNSDNSAPFNYPPISEPDDFKKFSSLGTPILLKCSIVKFCSLRD